MILKREFTLLVYLFLRYKWFDAVVWFRIVPSLQLSGERDEIRGPQMKKKNTRTITWLAWLVRHENNIRVWCKLLTNLLHLSRFALMHRKIARSATVPKGSSRWKVSMKNFLSIQSTRHTVEKHNKIGVWRCNKYRTFREPDRRETYACLCVSDDGRKRILKGFSRNRERKKEQRALLLTD